MPARLGELTYRKTADLRRNPENAREHPVEQVEAIRASFREFGVLVPLLLKDDEKTIGAGHGRLDAAEAEDLAEVPTITIFGLTDDQWTAFAIADNKLAEGSVWNEKLLTAQLGKLASVGFNLGAVGFTLAELDSLRDGGGGKGKKKASLDAEPAPPKNPVTRAGDAWHLGDHLLICGDSTDPATVARALDGRAIPLTLTDPPYGIGFGYSDHDDRSNEDNAELVAKVFALAPGGKVWSPGPMNVFRDGRRFGEAKMIYWHKTFTTALNGLGGAATVEPILVLGPLRRRRLDNDYCAFRYDQEELEGRSLKEHHPCPKPVALFAHLAEAFCPKGGRVYEPFCGSGTTILACEQVKRKCHAIEIDPAYVDVAILRWQGMTRREARLVDGGTYAQMKAERGV